MFPKIVFAALAACAAAGAAPAVFQVTDYGATGDGKSVDTAAIQKALDAAAAAGSGVVVLKPGTYLSGAIFVKSGTELRIDDGAVIRGVQSLDGYPIMQTRVAGIEMKWPAALINVYRQSNVKISGKGIVDGDGKVWWDLYWKMRREEYEPKGIRWAVDYDCRRPRLIQVYESSGVDLSGLTLKRSGFWTVHICYSRNVNVDGITIRNNSPGDGRGPSTDGVDIDSSSEVTVSHCDIECNDDAICLKAGRDADGLRVNRPTRKIVIHDNTVRGGAAGVTFGSETSGGISDVEVYRLNVMSPVPNGILFKSASTRGGTIENIQIHDVEMENVATVFSVQFNWNPSYSYAKMPEGIQNPPDYWRVLTEPVPPEKGIPHLRNVKVSGIHATGARQAFAVSSYPQSPLRNFEFRNIDIDARTAGSVQQAEGWSFSDVSIRTADGSRVPQMAPPRAGRAPAAPTRADILRGEYGPYRANNDLLFYHLDVRVDPEKKFISGKNTIRFKMLRDGKRIQLDLHKALNIDKILYGTTPLTYQREEGAVFVDFPETLRSGRTYSIEFYYSGNPVETGRFGGIAFRKDPSGHAWINTACEGEGASIWWPNKDQWRDEVENMRISVSIPNDLEDVSNGRFVGKTDLGDGYTRWDWFVHYPINNYDVSLNIGNYKHFADKLGDLPLDFYALPEHLEKAKLQFAQAKGMLQAYQHYFGEYPFKKDGYKLIEAPYSGMEHQSAVTYGNHFANGYLERDWTGVGISPKFDFIIIHESGHEWFGNSVTAADVSDMWIHEGWTTYLEGLYVEYMFGHDDAIKYLNGYKSKVRNREPIITQRGVNRTPPQDQYFKGALFLNTLRSVVNDDRRWWALLRGFYQQFKYRNIMTEDVVRYFNQKTGMNLTPVFDQYLRHAAIPTLELKFDETAGTVSYRWKADEASFAMPVRVGAKGQWQIIDPTTEWKTLKTPLKRDELAVATDLYYVNVSKVSGQATDTAPVR